MRWSLPEREMVRRRRLLLADSLLSRLERAWVDTRGRRFRYDHVDPATGRTDVEHLRERRFGPAVSQMTQGALDRGLSQEAIDASLEAAAEQSAAGVVHELHRRSPQMLRDHRAVRRGMQRRMRAVWGPAFDAFYELYVCAEEVGSELQQLHRDEADPLVGALLGLHARACLLLAEIHALMTEGFPLGAWARTRSLHESAVISSLLADHGRAVGCDDLGERFVRHGAIDEARDAELAVSSGVAVDPTYLDHVRAERAALVTEYGRMFAKDYGWARPLFPGLGPKERVTFERLESRADTGLSRLDYRLGGHHVHSSAWSVALNSLPRGGTTFRLTGPTNIGFGEPAAVASAAVLASTEAVIRGVEARPDPMNLVGLHAMRSLGASALKRFETSQALVDRREERLQARISRRRGAANLS